MADTKLKLLRVLEILQETDVENPLTASQIIKKLKLHGLEAERKSIYRDIEVLVEAGYAIEKSSDNKAGYYFAKRKFEDWELKILIDAVWGAKFLNLHSTQSITKRLMELSSKAGVKLLKRITPIRGKIKSEIIITKIYIDKILKAIKGNKKIIFQYSCIDFNLEEQLRFQGKYYCVNPYALILQNQSYYLIGNYDKYDDLDCYCLDRIFNLEISSQHIKPAGEITGNNVKIELEEFVTKSIYRFAGEKINLELFCQRGLEVEIIDYFGSSANCRAVEEGFYCTIMVNKSNGLFSWLLQHGSRLMVVAPLDLQVLLKAELKKTLAQYE